MKVISILLLGWLPGLLAMAVGAEDLPEGWNRQNTGEPRGAHVRSPGTRGEERRLSGPDLSRLAIVGRWRERGRDGTLDLRPDGTFTAVDNEGLAVAGRYELTTDRTLRFEIQRDGVTHEIVSLDFSLQDDELTLTATDGRGAERYRRQP